MEQYIQKANVLLEALPYIRRFYGKVVVIKFGGSSMSEAHQVRAILEDIVFMKFVGMLPVVIHGGGPAITEAMKASGKTAQFVHGLRVTDRETMDIVEYVLLHKINRDLVLQLEHLGAQAVTLSGLDDHLIDVEKMTVAHDGSEVDLGFVGDIRKVQADVIDDALAQGKIPVIAPIGVGPDGLSYNINGDIVAGDIAAALRAEKLVYLTDVEGIMCDVTDSSSLIRSLSVNEIAPLIADGVISGGMIPKVNSCLKALKHGAQKTHIVNGHLSHSLLLEIFTDQGIGTEVVSK